MANPWSGPTVQPPTGNSQTCSTCIGSGEFDTGASALAEAAAARPASPPKPDIPLADRAAKLMAQGLFNLKLAGSAVGYTALEKVDGKINQNQRFPSDEKAQAARNKQDPNVALLDRYNVGHVKELVDSGKRIPGSGYLAGSTNNNAQVADWLNTDTAETLQPCYQQTESFVTSPKAKELRDAGWKIDRYDQSKPSAEGVEHMFVLATAPDGRTYRMDPWYNKVEPFDPSTAQYKGVVK